MKPLAVWLDRYVEAAVPGLDQALAMRGVVVLRCFERTPSPAASRRLEQYRQAVVLGGRDAADRAARVELATTTLTWPVVLISPRGEARQAFRAGVVDVVEPQPAPAVAARIALMSEVPIVSAARPRTAISGEHPAVGMAPAVHPAAPRIAVVVSSTGGSFVIAEILRALPRRSGPAVLLAQHLDAEFVPFFAEWLGQASGWKVVVVSAPVPLTPGVVFLAAGGRDLVVEGEQVTTAPASTHWIPSGDALLRSLARALPEQTVGLVLSGMGTDGSSGLQALAAAGGAALCQSPATSVVPSMPERALALCSTARALSPEELARALRAS